MGAGLVLPPVSKTSHVLVAGAGPAGLTAAWKLAEAGHEVTVVERAPVPGGMSASFDVAGQRVDFGSHRLHGRADPALLDELRGLMGNDLQTRQRNGRIRLVGEWVAFPLRAGDLIRNLPRRFALGAAFDSLTSPFRRPAANDFGSIVRAGLGSTVFEAFYEPYAKKLWGIDASAIDGSMAERRVSAGSPIDIAKRLLAARNEHGRVFYYPRLGYGQISEALAGATERAGAHLRFGASMTSVSLADRVVASVDIDGSAVRVEADVLVSTIPVQQLVRIATPSAAPDVMTAAKALNHRGMVFVYLVVPQDQYTRFDAHYFPGLDTVIARLSEPKNYRAGSDPVGQTVLCAELSCTVGDEIWETDDESLGELVARQLLEQGLPNPNHVETHVRRRSAVYPVYAAGYRSHLDTIERWVAAHPQLVTAGRQGLFVPDNLHHAIAMGRAISMAIRSDGTVDRDAWNRAREGFRSHVVED